VNFASYNIQYGFGLDGRYDLERIARSLEGADVMALQEVTRGFFRNRYADMPAAIAAWFPSHFWVYGPACDMHAGAPPGEPAPPAGVRFQFGNMVLSRWPILSARTLLLPRGRTAGGINLQRGATEALIEIPAGALRVYSVHLDHISAEERARQLRFLKERIAAFTREGGSLTGAAEFGLPELPTPEDYVILGDFNMEPGSPEYAVLAGGPVDAFAALSAYRPGSYSWMDPRDCGKRMHLDYCFVGPGLEPRLKSVRIDTDSVGSDHFPLWVEIGD
jgi:endonuclease/exonuclease/phosphatase family metal-dependent hydrolase